MAVSKFHRCLEIIKAEKASGEILDYDTAVARDGARYIETLTDQGWNCVFNENDYEEFDNV